MDPSTVKAWLDVVWQLGLGFTFGCVAFIWMLARGMVVWGWHYRAERAEKLLWRDAALHGKIILRKLVDREESRV